MLLLSLVTFSYPKGGDSIPATNEIDQPIIDKLHSTDGFFTENAGQVPNEQVRFYSSSGMQAGFAESAVLVKLVEREHSRPLGVFEERMRGPRIQRDDPPSVRGVMVRVTFPGSNKVMPQGVQEMPHRSNYFIGNDPSKWRTGVPSYQEIVYRNLYDGIDLSYRTQAGQLKYEFIISQGADPALITVSYEGVENLRIDQSDELVVSTALGELRDGKPIAYQDGREVECAFVQRASLSFGFRCEGRDPSRPLVIDPLVYATFLGGSDYDWGTSITVDSSGNAYVAGETYSTDFPATLSAFDTTYNGGASDAFVAKLNAAGSALVYATFLGGDNYDKGYGIAVDSSGSAYVTGYTDSADFPTTPGSFDTTFNGISDAFMAKLNAPGSALVYSTFLGGGNEDAGRGIAVDSSGNAYVTGYTWSADFPATPGSFDTTYNGDYDAFVAKLDAAGHALVYSTFLGGGNHDEGYGIAVDSSGNAYVTGHTHSKDFPATPGSFDTTFNGSSDAFVAKLDLAGSVLVYSTFLGGGGNEESCDIAIDSSGSAYVTGYTDSADFPATPGSFDTTFNGGYSDAFAARLNAAGSALVYATFLGGGDGEWSNGIAVDSSGGAYISGQAYSTDFPATLGSFDTTHDGAWDGFVAKLDMGGGANTPPEIMSFAASPSPSFEGDVVLFAVNATDADGDALTYDFDFESDGVFDVSGPSSTAMHVYGDDFNGTATVIVSDGNLSAEATTPVIVLNIPPSVDGEITATATFDITLRVAGEKWHDVNLTIYRDRVAVADASVTRFPGSPDDQAATIENVTIDLFSGNLSAVVRYTPDDDPVNGQPNGANPAWLILTAKDGSESKIHHTFNVRHNDTWIWRVDDLRAFVAGMSLTFTATATDPGSDDLTFTWDWGDGTPATITTYFNDGIGPDPYPSPGGVFPFIATDFQKHVYSTVGKYDFKLTVRDDDGGARELLVVIIII